MGGVTEERKDELSPDSADPLAIDRRLCRFVDNLLRNHSNSMMMTHGTRLHLDSNVGLEQQGRSIRTAQCKLSRTIIRLLLRML
jgi:hypothetical protein